MSEIGVQLSLLPYNTISSSLKSFHFTIVKSSTNEGIGIKLSKNSVLKSWHSSFQESRNPKFFKHPDTEYEGLGINH